MNVTAIAEEAFAYNTGITHVDLSDTQVTAIPEGCFMGDTRLKTVILPDTATNIGKNAFSGTTADVYINNPACTITDAFDKNYNGVIMAINILMKQTTLKALHISMHRAFLMLHSRKLAM